MDYILKIITEEFEQDVKLSDKLFDYADSLGVFEILSILSNETDINYIDMQVSKEMTIQDIVDWR